MLLLVVGCQAVPIATLPSPPPAPSSFPSLPAPDRPLPDDAVVYPTYGIHNPPENSPCEPKDCIAVREPGQPSDPQYPAYWTSNWNMYVVTQKYVEFPPPYAGKPPDGLIEGVDYTVSTGTTWYDSTWSGTTGEGAMEEHYVGRCLPIFPIANNFTCSFISLGDTAYFVTYDQDRPAGMPPVCLFSDLNHPPRRGFIEHLPYALGDSKQLDMKIQGYSFWISKKGKVVQVGVSPDRTADTDILFGYAFDAVATPDAADPTQAPYRHPQSFYFSGYPLSPANAPIVSQNYTDFAMVKPDPKKTWAQVSGIDPKSIPRCQLFPNSTKKTARTWSKIAE